MKIHVLGAGSLGCAIGGTLAAAGSDVTLIARSREHVDAVNAKGLVMRDADGGERIVKVAAATDARSLAPADLVIVLVKSFHTEAAIEGYKAALGEHTIVMSLQNGLGHEEVLAKAVGRARLLAGKTYVGGVFLAPGVVRAGVKDKLTLIGEPYDTQTGGISERVRRIAAEFERAGLKTTVCDNITGTIWDKLLVNTATGALSAITRLPYGPLYALPELEATAVAAVAEAMAVARAKGVKLSIREPIDAWRMAGAGLGADFKASMLQSLEKGSVTEIDFINGAVVAEGERLGIPTPVNRTLVACIKGIEKAMQ
ncbi:MAG TPA: ketopantoate reductase family protein [Burkholderiaceae bacterium]|nr:ketopantoate reductase family protein [Burkholderiaceae bacterium]